MTISISLARDIRGNDKFIGARSTALPIRQRIEEALESGQEVIVDFTGVSVTQSFTDELVGAIMLRQGPRILDRMSFKGCAADVKAIIRFVMSDRARQFAERSLARSSPPSQMCLA